MFEKCKIIVSSEEEKQELLKGCKHIHDFSVFFKNEVRVIDEFGLERKVNKEDCGVCLNFDAYPFVNFLAGLYDCDDKSVRGDHIEVVVEKIKYNPSQGLPIGIHFRDGFCREKTEDGKCGFEEYERLDCPYNKGDPKCSC
jgi:hypothetical protein